MTFEDLVSLEPRLGDLLGRATAVEDDLENSWFCANSVFVGMREQPSFARELRGLVGFYAAADPRSVLRSREAYDVAYKTVYYALPECRDCACWEMN